VNNINLHPIGVPISVLRTTYRALLIDV